MYKIERRFTVPIGHRLSKHDGLCKNIHGHNFTVHVGVKSERLDDNDMVMDFSFLKAIVQEEMDKFDHCLMLNEADSALARDLRIHGICSKVIEMPHDPTAERLAERIFYFVKETLAKDFSWVTMDYVTVYENENSKATYSE